MTGAGNHSSDQGFIVGLVLVVVGSVLLMHKLDLLQDLFELWPAALIAVGVAKLLEYDERTAARQ